MHGLNTSSSLLRPEASDLIAENPPSFDELRATFPDWILWYLKKSINSDPHYEASLYGAFNSFATSLFPTKQRFSINPQIILRKLLADHRINVETGDFSIGPEGGIHQSRNDGADTHLLHPDFAIVKIVPAPGPHLQHFVIALIEIKPHDPDIITYGNKTSARDQDAVAQMTKYMDRLNTLPNRDEQIKGFLVQGSYYLKFTARPHEETVVDSDDYKSLYAHDDPFTRELYELAREHWNRTTVDRDNDM